MFLLLFLKVYNWKKLIKNQILNSNLKLMVYSQYCKGMGSKNIYFFEEHTKE